MKTHIYLPKNIREAFILFAILFTMSLHVDAASYTVNSSALWSTCGDFSSTPTNADDITIASGVTLTVDVTNAVCKALTINSSGGILTFSGSGSPALTVTTTGGGTGTLTISGTLTMVSGATLTVNSITGSGTYNTNAGTINTTGGSIPSGKTWSTVNIQSGTINFTNNSNYFTSALTVASGAKITMGSGASLKGTATLSGSGTIRINAGNNSDDLSHQFNLTRDLSSMTLEFQLGPANQVIDTEIVCAGIISSVSIAVNTTFNKNVTVSGNISIGSGGTITIGSSSTLIPASSSIISGAGTLTGTGTIKVTATGNANDLLTQYSVTTLTLTNMTVQYAGTGTAQNLPAGTYSAFTVNNSSGVNLSGNVTVSGTLTFSSGSISLGTNNLTLASGIAISGNSSSSYIIINGSGSVIAQNITSSFTVPVGDEYAPVTISSGGGADYTISLINSITGNGGSPTLSDHGVGITWTITASTTQTPTFTFQWPGTSELTSFTRSSSYVAMRTSPSGTWSPLAAASAAGGADPYTQSATSTSMTGGTAYDFGIGDNSSTALPVSLINFQAAYNTGAVNLDWTTASEINNNYFEIQRSANGNNWTAIGKVDGHGNSMEINHYNAQDNLAGIVTNGNIYYRLKQVDYNGAFMYSDIRTVSLNNLPVTLGLYPNPASSYLNVDWANADNENAVLRVVNINGVELYREAISGKGDIHKQIDMISYPAGTYFVQIITGNNVTSKTIFKN